MVKTRPTNTFPRYEWGARLILDERIRQVLEEKRSPAQDAHYTGDELAIAGVSYALPPRLRRIVAGVPAGWPWGRMHWKPTPDRRIRELVKAGALIAAEIDRRLAAGEEP